MKASVSVWNLRDEIAAGKLDQLDALEVIAELGGEGAELSESYFPDTSDEYLRKLLNRAKAAGIELCSLDAHNAFTDPDSEQGREQIEWTKKWIRIAAHLGLPNLNVFTGTIIEGVDLDTQKRWAIESFKRCVDVAEEMQMPLALENHNLLAATGDEILWFLEQVGSPWLRTNPDPTNFVSILDCPDEELETLYIETGKIAPFMVNAHMKHGEFTPAGELMRVDVRRLIALYRQVGYDGHVVLEWIGVGDARQSTAKGIELLKRHMGNGKTR